MRHRATLVAAMEGVSRSAFYIARELAQNSRSGLTVRFLSKKLAMQEEEVEYLVDIHGQLFFSDLTKIKIVAEGLTSIKRIQDGLENRGDVESLYALVRGLDAHEFRILEEQIGIHQPGPKKAAVEQLLEDCYRHPDSVIEYVASRNFSPKARELFDIVWQSKSGIMPLAKLRTAHGGSEYEIEQALDELLKGMVLFEMFRFDSEDRLIRVVGLLSEIRQWRESEASEGGRKTQLRPQKNVAGDIKSVGLTLTDRLCRIVAAIAAKPARLRGDGDLFREDRRRVTDASPEDDPSFATCLWIAQGVKWLVRVDNELRAGDVSDLVKLDPLSRHKIVFDWLASNANEAESRRILTGFLEEAKPKAWYSVTDFVAYAVQRTSENEQAVMKSAGGHWHYVSSAGVGTSERGLARSLEETFLWLGVVDRIENEDSGLFRISELGECFLVGQFSEKVVETFAPKTGAIIVQPNFDIVVPTQEVDPLLAIPLDQFADRKSTGTAVVYHLSKDSFTRAVQSGHDGDGFMQFLLKNNRGGSLPANVMTTLEDWRGGMKRVKLRTLSVLESDDPLVIADLLHRRRFTKFFAAVDPHKTLAYVNIQKTDLEKELEKEGFVVS